MPLRRSDSGSGFFNLQNKKKHEKQNGGHGGCAVWMACARLQRKIFKREITVIYTVATSGRGEWTAYALSRDGLHYEDPLGGDPVYDVEKLSPIEGGGARCLYLQDVRRQRVRDGDDGYEQP